MGIFWVVLEALGISLGFDFYLHSIIPGECPPSAWAADTTEK